MNHQLSLFTLRSHHHGSVENGCISNRSFPHHVGWSFRAARAVPADEVRQHVPRLAGWVVGASRCAFPTLAPARGAGRAEGVWWNWPTGPRPKQGNIYWKKLFEANFLHASKRNLYKMSAFGLVNSNMTGVFHWCFTGRDEVDESIQRSSALRNP